MRSLKLHRFRKLARDPFMVAIAIVVMVPALLVAYAIANQNHTQSSVNGVSQEAPSSQDHQTSSSSSSQPTDPKPITEAEQPVPAEAPQALAALPAPLPAAEPASACSQEKKQAAENARAAAIQKENRYHDEQKNILSRLVAVVYRRRWDEEKTRHNNVLNEIEATYRAALAAANC